MYSNLFCPSPDDFLTANTSALEFTVPTNEATQCVGFTFSDDMLVEGDDKINITFFSDNELDMFVESEAIVTILDDESK